MAKFKPMPGEQRIFAVGPTVRRLYPHHARPQRELSQIVGRKVDLNTIGFLSPYFVDEVLAEAEVLSVAA